MSENNSGKDWQGMYNELVSKIKESYTPDHTNVSKDFLEENCTGAEGYDYGYGEGFNDWSGNLLNFINKQQENN